MKAQEDNPLPHPDQTGDADKYRIMVEYASEAVFVLQNSRILFVNPRVSLITGMERQELIGKSFLKVLHPQYHTEALDYYNRVLHGESLPPKEYQILHKDGHPIWFSSSSICVDWDGKPAVLCMGNDITEQHQMREEIQKAEARYRRIIETSNEGVWEIDQDMNMVYANNRTAEILGYTPEEILGKSFYNFVDPEEVKQQKENIKQRKKGVSERYIRTYIHKDGSKRTLLVSATPVQDEKGKYIGSFALVSDLTERVKSEKKLRESEERYRILAETAKDVILIHDLNGKILYINQAGKNLLGFTSPENNGVEVKDFIDPSDFSLLYHFSQERAKGFVGPRLYEIGYRNKDGEIIPMEVSSSPILKDGKPVNILVIARDISERILNQKRIQESEEKFSKAFYGNIVPMMISSPDGQIIELNNAMSKLLGKKRVEESVLTLQNLDFFANPVTYYNVQQSLGANGFLNNHETEVINQDGEKRNVLLSAHVIHMEAKPYWLFVFIDITGMKKAEATLRKSESRLQRAEKIANFGNWEFVINENTVESSPGARSIYGIEDIHWNIPDIQKIPLPEYRSMLNETLSGLIKEGKPYDVEFKIKRPKDGIIRDIHSIAEFDPTENIVFGVIHDITNQRKMEQAIREREVLYRTIFEHAPVGIFRSTDDGKVLQVNREYAKIFGYSSPEEIKEVINKSDLATILYVEPELRGKLLNEVKQLGGGWLQKEVEYRRKDGGNVTANLVFRALTDDAHTIEGFIEDITARRQAEIALNQLNEELEQRVELRTRQLQEKNRELETFTYSVSHDLKAPLRGIDGYSRLLLDEYSDALDSEGKNFLNIIRQATHQMSQLIDDLLAYSRLERRPFQPMKVNLQELVNAIIAERSIDIENRAIQIRMDLPAVILNVDPDGLSLAIRNILDNAIKFTGSIETPVIQISALIMPTACILCIQDNGIGFDMKYKERIFDIFQRLHRSEEYPGTGIGLAIVRKSMERIGGSVRAESALGKGSQFYLELPL